MEKTWVYFIAKQSGDTSTYFDLVSGLNRVCIILYPSIDAFSEPEILCCYAVNIIDGAIFLKIKKQKMSYIS